MGCTLGQIGRTMPTGTTTVPLQSPLKINRAGDLLKIGGSFAVTAAQGRVLASQLSALGTHNTDQPIVPFTYAATQPNGDLDGVYAVVDTSVDYVKLAAGLFAWDAELAAVPSRQAALVESRIIGEVIDPNSHSIVAGTADTWISPGGSALAPLTKAGAAVSLTARTADEGTVYYAVPGSTYMSWRVTPSTMLVGAVRVEYTTDSGTTWYVLVGRQIPAVATGWRITNGLVRVTGLNPAIASDAKLGIEFYTGSAWSTSRSISVYNNGGSSVAAAPVAIEVLYERPDASAVRITYSLGQSLTIRLRRGSRYAEGLFSNVASAGNLQVTSPESLTSATGGAYGATAGGNKLVIGFPSAFTNNTTNLRTSSSLSSLRFALGVAIAAATTDTVEGAQGVLYQYYSATVERVEVVT